VCSVLTFVAGQTERFLRRVVSVLAGEWIVVADRDLFAETHHERASKAFRIYQEAHQAARRGTLGFNVDCPECERVHENVDQWCYARARTWVPRGANRKQWKWIRPKALAAE